MEAQVLLKNGDVDLSSAHKMASCTFSGRTDSLSSPQITDAFHLGRQQREHVSSSKLLVSDKVMVLQAIRYKRGELEILDQLRLPYEEVFIQIRNPQDGWNSIRSMQVRGAPAIAIVAALSLAVYLSHATLQDSPSSASLISQSLKFLVTSRPTAVNLLDAAKKLEIIAYSAQKASGAGHGVYEAYIKAAEQMLVDDVRDNERIGEHGAKWIETHGDAKPPHRKVSVITHCNTG